MIWKDRYSIGVEQIDNQHKELFARVYSFVNVILAKSDLDARLAKIDETLSFMKDYVITHFRDEEAYQLKIGYPDYEKHKKIHDGMLAYVGEVAKDYEENGYNEKSMQQFAGKLLAWLVNHVAAEDRKIAEYALSKGVASDDK